MVLLNNYGRILDELNLVPTEILVGVKERVDEILEQRRSFSMELSEEEKQLPKLESIKAFKSRTFCTLRQALEVWNLYNANRSA